MNQDRILHTVMTIYSCCSCYKFMNILWFVHLASELHARKQWFLKQFVKDPATMSLKLMVVILTVYCVAVAYAAPAESQSTCTTMDGTTDCMLHTCVHASGMVDNSSNNYMTVCAGCFGNYRVEAIPQQVCDDPCLLYMCIVSGIWKDSSCVALYARLVFFLLLLCMHSKRPGQILW